MPIENETTLKVPVWQDSVITHERYIFGPAQPTSTNHPPIIITQQLFPTTAPSHHTQEPSHASPPVTTGEGPGISTVSESGLHELLQTNPRIGPERPNDRTDHVHRSMLGYVRLFIHDPQDARVQILDGSIDKYV